jgi:GDP-L-fucose synthase
MSRFWANKKVVVTGAAGMAGSRLCRFLLDVGALVTGMDNFSRGTTRVLGVHYLEFPYNDATNPHSCRDAFESADVVFNLAAHVGGVYFNLKNQAEQFWGNMQLQSIPAIAAAQTGVPIFVQVSTVCVYSEPYNNPAQESYGHVGNPEPANAGYAWAKRMGENTALWAYNGVNVPGARVLVVRPTNMYGINDYFDERAHVIPALIKKFIRNDDDVVTVYGGSQYREFIYADDAARGMMAVAEHGTSGEAYNLGTNGETVITIGELACMLRRLLGSGASIAFDEESEIGDRHRCTDSTKAQALGWRYKIGLPYGLSEVIEWYVNR